MLVLNPRSPLGRIAQMGAAFACSSLARRAIGFATSILVGRALGLDDFGRWTFCLAWASTLTGVFDLGFGVLLTRDSARAADRIGALLGGALVVRVGLFIPAGVVFYVASPWLGFESSTVEGLRIAVFLAASGVAYGCFAAVFRARPRWLLAILSLEAVAALVQCIGSWLIARQGGSLVGLIRLAAAVQLIQLVAAAAMWRVVAPACDALEWPKWSTIQALARRAFPFALAGVVANVQVRLAPLVLGYLSTAAEVASFGAASRIGNLVRVLPYAAFGGALPVFSYEVSQGQPEGLQPRFDRALRWFAVAASAAVALLAAPLIRVTYGARFAGARWALVWLAASLLPSLLNSGLKVYLFATGRERRVLRWSTIALTVQAIGCAWLIPRFGASGAAIALGIGELSVWWPLVRDTRDRTARPSSPHRERASTRALRPQSDPAFDG